MKFQINLKELSEAVSLAAYAVAPKGIKPILANILVLAGEEEVRFVGTDMEIMLIAKVKAQVEQKGYFTIPAKLLQDVVASLALPSEGSGTISFELDVEDESRIRIATGRNNFYLQIQGIEEYPPVPVLEEQDSATFTIESEKFNDAIKEASIAMSNEEGNPVQRGLCVDFSNEQFPIVAATDSKRLAVTAVADLQVPEEFRKVYILPSRAVNELQKLSDSSKEVNLSLYKEQLVFNTEKFVLITRLVDGRFPDYNRVIPKDPSRKLKVNRKEIAQALKAVLPIARNSEHLVNFEISQNETRVWAYSNEQGSAEVFVSSQLDGEPIHIAFNIKYVQDFVGAVTDEEIVIEMTTPVYPGLFKTGNLESHYQYVVMPMAVDIRSQETA